MAVIAEAVRHLIAAGVSGDSLVQAIEDMENASAPERTARQERNRRYYEKKASEKRLKASYSDTPPPNGSNGFPHPSLTSLTSPLKTPKGVKIPPHKIPDGVSEELWNDFLEVRRKLKAVNSERAINSILADLSRWKAKGHCPASIIETSIRSSWKDVYEPKQHSPPYQHKPRPAEPKANVATL